MENSETSNSINEEQNELSRKFLKITNVKIFSNAYNLRLKEDDIIIGFNGGYFNSSYEDLKKVLDEEEWAYGDQLELNSWVQYQYKPSLSLSTKLKFVSEKDISEFSDLKKNLDQVKELNPIIMSSLQFVDISPNFEQIEKLSTSGLLFVLSNPSVDTDLKIFCSEMLVKQGRISADMLSEAYQLSSFDEKEIQKAESLFKSLSPIRARPLLYQSIIRDNKPESKFRKIIALIKSI